MTETLTASNPLDETVLAQYREEGYLVVPDLLDPLEVDAFLAHERERDHTRSYGLHGHLHDPHYRYLAMHPKVVAIARQMTGGPLRIVQTMLLDKPPSGQGIALHQDSHYLRNEPNTLMACWIALTDADADNGGLCVVPGSHRNGLRSAHKNENVEEHASWETDHILRDREGREWPERLVSFEIDAIDPDEILRLTVSSGGGVFFTGLTIHGSFANRSPTRQRSAFATHYIHADAWVFRTDVQETMPVP